MAWNCASPPPPWRASRTRPARAVTPVRELCQTLFKDYQFGLKLIAQNSGTRAFDLDADAVDAPDKVLSEWVVASYQRAKDAGTA
jgi:hypothetical protein